MASWPSTLPNAQLSGYELAPVDATVRSPMEVGAARSRRRTAARNDQVNVNWIMTDAQMSTFRTWFESDVFGAAGGAAWFTINLGIGTGRLATMTARFIGPFKASGLGALYWGVSAQLELRT